MPSSRRRNAHCLSCWVVVGEGGGLYNEVSPVGGGEGIQDDASRIFVGAEYILFKFPPNSMWSRKCVRLGSGRREAGGGGRSDPWQEERWTNLIENITFPNHSDTDSYLP